MTDRLTDLLVREADGLDVPPPPAGVVLARGRRLRRRRTATVAAGVAAALLAVGGIGVAASLGGGGRAETAGDPVLGPGAVFSIGTTVYYDGGERSTQIDDAAVKTLFYTSEGVVVRHGDNPYSDGGGAQRFSLLTPDGEAQPLPIETVDLVQASDPAQPYLVWAEPSGGSADVVVWDVGSRTEVARVAVPDVRARYLPVALDGDLIYLDDGRHVHVVDWRTGRVTDSQVLSSPSVAGGHAVDGFGRTARVVDAATGRVLLEADTGGYGYFLLSPDGRFAMLAIEEGPERVRNVDVYDVATGDRVTLAGRDYDYGWTPDDHLFRVDGDEVTTCSPASGRCQTEQVEIEVEEGSAASDEQVCDDTYDDAGNVIGTMCYDDQGEDDYSDDLVLGGRTYRS